MARRTPIEEITVHPAVWADALRQAGGDPDRIEVVSPTSVVIHNRPDWREGSSAPAQQLPAAAPNVALTPPPPAESAPPETVDAPEPQRIPSATFVAPRLDSED
jgi:hypothetical protein